MNLGMLLWLGCFQCAHCPTQDPSVESEDGRAVPWLPVKWRKKMVKHGPTIFDGRNSEDWCPKLLSHAIFGVTLGDHPKQSYDPVGTSKILQEINAINKAEFCIWSWPLGTLPLVLVKHAFEHWGTPSWAPIVHIPTEATKHMHVQFYIQSHALFCLPNKWF